jgi:ribosomal protein S18 acetylase RimI-like enzyme
MNYRQTLQPITDPQRVKQILNTIHNEYVQDISVSRGSVLSNSLISEFASKALEVAVQPNHAFFDIVVEDQLVGFSWVSEEPERLKTLFIHYLYINPHSRRLGYGKNAIKDLCLIGKQRALTNLTLHVFSHNKKALIFYESVGFAATGIQMLKLLSSD